jgi:hypothetical protein
MLSVDRILGQTRKALTAIDKMNIGDARALLADVIETLEHPAIRYICVDNELYEQARAVREQEIRHGVSK